MSREWRLLQDGITDAHQHFAVEEALVRLVDEGVSPPTLRLRQVRRAAFVGVYQDTWAAFATPPSSPARRSPKAKRSYTGCLPKLNCQACGEATCMAFAFGLLMGGHHLPECPRLQEVAFVEGGLRLEELLG